MQLNRIERRILCGAARDLARFAVMPWPDIEAPNALRNRFAISDAREGLVAVQSVEWVGQSTCNDTALRMAISRAYLKLQKHGLLMRVADGYSETRCTHLRLTEAGIALAKQLEATEGTSRDQLG